MDARARCAAKRVKVVAANNRLAYLLALRNLAFIMRFNGIVLSIILFMELSSTHSKASPTKRSPPRSFMISTGIAAFELDEVRLPRNAQDLVGYEHCAPDAPKYGFGYELSPDFKS